jgi:hypothetical protein
MSINPLNDISKVYLEQVSAASRARNAVADDRLDAEQDKTNASMNRLRNQNNRFNRALASDAARKVERDVKKSSAYGPQRPKPGTVTGRRIEDPKPTGSKPKGYRVEENEIDEAQKPNDGNLANNYPPYDKITRGDVIAGRLGKDEMGGKKKKSKGVKEGYSNWRQDLAEVMNDVEDNTQIKEKKNINNKVKTSAMGGGIKLGEAVEEIGGTLLEMVEIDEVDFIVESVYGELLDEGYEEDDIEEALEYALTEATVTFGHDTDSPRQKKSGAGQLVKAVGRLARQKLSSKVRGAKKSASAAVARGARKVAKGALGVARKMEGGDKAPKTVERKPSTYRGAGAGTKERVSSGSYTPPTKKKAEKPSDPWGEPTTPAKPKATTKKSTAPKAKAPATTKRKRKSKLDSLLSDIRNESIEINEMPYQVLGSPDGGKEKKVGKPVKSKKYADARATELADTHKATGGKYRSQYVEEIEIDEDAGIVSGLVGLALGAKGAYNAAKKSKRMRDYPKNFVKGVVDPRTYVPQKKKDQKEEFQIDEKTLTTAEKKKREEIAQSMNLADFERRYPGRGMEVKMATATKLAKKMVEQMDTEMSSEPVIDKKKQMLDKQKLANMKMLQQKQQMIQRQKLQMQRAGKLPLEAN